LVRLTRGIQFKDMGDDPTRKKVDFSSQHLETGIPEQSGNTGHKAFRAWGLDGAQQHQHQRVPFGIASLRTDEKQSNLEWLVRLIIPLPSPGAICSSVKLIYPPVFHMRIGKDHV
jgi:hypothetical protein